MANKDVTEYLIAKVKAEGLLDGYKRARKPKPPKQTDDTYLKAGYRILEETGALPKEIELKKAIADQYEKLNAAETPEQREEEFRKLAELQMVLGVEQDARRKFYTD
ncbi:DnaJ family domain-containing protein [uncultured Cohaesibacter sp.]|uniref:DnaJ family domain-containing protein n=1 Tax=uncultured Cohaesibacter sp. TaxID=1002546 RepID=UPI0029C88C5C|nr:DnaJ family domain-containing protein [uncultured Cohaesibacter sp.]